MKPTRKAPHHREPPDLPEELAPATIANLEPDGGAIVLAGRQLDAAAWVDGKAAALRLEACVLQGVRLAGSEFGSVTWKDVRLVACDLANVTAHRIQLLRVELVDCRLAGLAVRAAEWRDVLVRNSDLRFAQLSNGIFQRCEFSDTDLEETDLREADLRGTVLRGCRLRRADLRQARLHGADLRHSNLEEMLAGVADVNGAIVDPAQAMVLARLMGLQIR